MDRTPFAIASLDDAHAHLGAAHLAFLRAILVADAEQAWVREGARDLCHWLSMRYGLSYWKASRCVDAARALESLPETTSALSAGDLSLDKVLELTRFASPSDEGSLIAWAQEVSTGAVRRRADLARRAEPDEAEAVDSERDLRYWHEDEGRVLGLQARLPAASGDAVVRAIERVAATLTPLPGEETVWSAGARRADALVAICGTRLAADPDPDRATVVVHADVDVLSSGEGSAELEGDGIVAAPVAQRLLCNARIQTLFHDGRGQVTHLAEMRREPAPWLVREVRRRDRGCVFPGCGTRAFTEAHHIRFWSQGGRTTAENLALICSFHHKLVQEYRWKLRRLADGTLQWHTPDWRRHPRPREAVGGVAVSEAVRSAG